MSNTDYLNSYKFNWETFEIIAGGISSLDAKNYMSSFQEREQAHQFLLGYGFDINNPIQNAELFGNFQEAIQFIKRYFIKEGNPDGLDVTLPNVFYSITDMSSLLLIATGSSDTKTTVEDSIWAGIILKVMHTILHADKDLRYRYFSTIQTQIFDRFYKYLHRDEDDRLFLYDESKNVKIELLEFETKAKKSRESTIIKLLHKKESVAEELFDRIGIRFVTASKVDVLRVMKFLQQNYIIMVNNIKPSRSLNSLISFEKFRDGYYKILKNSLKQSLNEEEFKAELENLAENCDFNDESYKENQHSSQEYKAIHFTCRQLIKYKNPFLKEFNDIRQMAKENESDSDLAKKILSLDTGHIAKDVRFFYPFEIQITDEKSHKQNSIGDASHVEYKKSQQFSAMKRLFKSLIEFQNLDVD